MSDNEYDWDFEGMSDEELDSYLDHAKGTPLEEFILRIRSLYQKLRAEVAENEVPDAFKDVIQDMDLDESETTE